MLAKHLFNQKYSKNSNIMKYILKLHLSISIYFIFYNYYYYEMYSYDKANFD